MDKVSTQENSSCQIFENYTVLENCIKLTVSLSTAFKNSMSLSQEHLIIWYFTEVFSLYTGGLGNSSSEHLGLIFLNKNNTVIHFSYKKFTTSMSV